MSKVITLDYEGTKFELEMSRNSVMTMEANGFAADQIKAKPMTMIPELVYGAFTMHHPRVKRSLVDEIYASIPDKEAFITALVEMYTDTLDTLTATPENTKNVSWKMSN